jgi:hypothetical protein
MVKGQKKRNAGPDSYRLLECGIEVFENGGIWKGLFNFCRNFIQGFYCLIVPFFLTIVHASFQCESSVSSRAFLFLILFSQTNIVKPMHFWIQFQFYKPSHFHT